MLTRLVAAMALLGASVASAEVRDAARGGFTVENSRIVRAAPTATWAALVGEVDHWWPRGHTWWGKESTLSIEAVAGGCFCERAGPREASHMTVVHADPPQLMRMTGALGPMQGMGLHGVLEWRLEPVTDGTRITLWYRAGGYAPDDLVALAPVVDRVQALQLGGLADFLDGADVPAPSGEKGER